MTRLYDRARGWLGAFHRTTAGGSYVPQIDGLRLLAILPVVLWHVSLRVQRFGEGIDEGARTALALVPSGHIGVALFFFVSGYIISYPYVTGRPPAPGRFYARRLTRITPPTHPSPDAAHSAGVFDEVVAGTHTPRQRRLHTTLRNHSANPSRSSWPPKAFVTPFQPEF